LETGREYSFVTFPFKSEIQIEKFSLFLLIYAKLPFETSVKFAADLYSSRTVVENKSADFILLSVIFSL